MNNSTERGKSILSDQKMHKHRMSPHMLTGRVEIQVHEGKGWDK